MSALDDKDVPSAEQWKAAVEFMTSALQRQIKRAEDDLEEVRGPTSFYDRWVRWRSQTSKQVNWWGLLAHILPALTLVVLFLPVVRKCMQQFSPLESMHSVQHTVDSF